jgi:hypothetical protein
MKCLSYIAVLMITSFTSNAQSSISVNGSWNASVSSIVVIEAGNDYDVGYFIESSTNQTNISINADKKVNWRVSVSKSDILWDSRFVLEVKRNETPQTAKINGGLTYFPITNLSTYFFDEQKSQNNIPIQYKLSGLSVLIPSGNYSTNVVYTVMDF